MKWIALATLVALSLVRMPSPVVKISSGLVRGTVSDNGKYYEYFGIPYATVDETNRFQAPLPAPKWEGIFEAVEENHFCLQRLPIMLIVGHTDCLRLNIYAPTTARSSKLVPVMVHFHPGYFIHMASTRIYFGGDDFMDHDVILIGVNYRLSIEGFLCLLIKEAPGNAGLKDVVAALKWIQENIRSFGGDPDNVTIMGVSAGATMAALVALSPTGKGLFHKMILQGGSALPHWTHVYNSEEAANDFVKSLGHNTSDPLEMYNIISKLSPLEALLSLEQLTANSSYDWVSVIGRFRPCIETPIDGVEAFMTDYPISIYASGNYTKVPVIMGYNDMEGMIVVSDTHPFFKKREKDWLLHLVENYFFSTFPAIKCSNITIEKIENFYTSEGNWQILDLIDLYSDISFKFPMTQEFEVIRQTTDQPIFRYLFKYEGWMNYVKVYLGFMGYHGASHSDEIFYLYKPYSIPSPHRFLERKQIDRMLTLWTNFAKYSDPTPETSDLIPIRWPPSTHWNQGAFVIDRELSIGPSWDERSAGLWNNTYNELLNNSKA